MQSFTARMPLLMATSTFVLGQRRWSSPQQCHLHCLHTVHLITDKISALDLDMILLSLVNKLFLSV